MSRISVLCLVLGCSPDQEAPDPSEETTSEPQPKGSGTPKGTPTFIDDDRILVIPHADGVTFLNLDGTVAREHTWSDLAGSCGRCGGEGGSPDGDGLLFSFTTGGGRGNSAAGAIARVSADGTPDFRVDGFRFPHDVMRDPADDTLMVVETFGNQVTWIAGDGSDSAALRVLDDDNPDFPPTPNGADRFDYEGRSLLVLSHLGAGGGPGARTGLLTLWDITTIDEPEFLWRFPESGRLNTPHGPLFRVIDGEWWLLFAHTNGASGDGSVGAAVTGDPTKPPTYVADLIPPEDAPSWRFLRGVDLTADQTLLMTDSGGLGANTNGKIIASPWPDLSNVETGPAGSIGDQTFVELESATEIFAGVGAPFEGWLWDGFEAAEANE